MINQLVYYLNISFQIIKINIIIMSENFDDLFDKFFSNNGEDAHMKRMRKLQEKLNKFDDKNGEVENPYEEELGEPDEVTRFNEGPYVFEKKVWHLEHGHMVKVDMVFSPLDSVDESESDIVGDMGDIIFGGKKRNRKQRLETQLESALEEERYEDAAYIRDKIKRQEDLKRKKETKSK
jgi:hypothetical protein